MLRRLILTRPLPPCSLGLVLGHFRPEATYLVRELSVGTDEGRSSWRKQLQLKQENSSSLFSDHLQLVGHLRLHKAIMFRKDRRPLRPLLYDAPSSIYHLAFPLLRHLRPARLSIAFSSRSFLPSTTFLGFGCFFCFPPGGLSLDFLCALLREFLLQCCQNAVTRLDTQWVHTQAVRFLEVLAGAPAGLNHGLGGRRVRIRRREVVGWECDGRVGRGNGVEAKEE